MGCQLFRQQCRFNVLLPYSKVSAKSKLLNEQMESTTLASRLQNWVGPVTAFSLSLTFWLFIFRYLSCIFFFLFLFLNDILACIFQQYICTSFGVQRPYTLKMINAFSSVKLEKERKQTMRQLLKPFKQQSREPLIDKCTGILFCFWLTQTSNPLPGPLFICLIYSWK